MIWDILSVLVTIMQFLLLITVLGAFVIFVPFTGLYLMSESFRDLLMDYEVWLDRKLTKRRKKKYTEEYGSFTAMVGYSAIDVGLTRVLYERQEPEARDIYEETALDHLVDPLGLLEQEARDFNTLNTATEYHNADPRK